MQVSTYLALLALLAVHHFGAVDATVVYKQYAWNMAGNVLMLDVGSMKYNMANSGLPVDSADQCQAACKLFPNCNAYVYCDNPNGCEGECQNYIKSHPNMPQSNGGQIEVPVSTPMPVNRRGPFASAGCLGTRWPQGTCTLKTLPAAQLDNPPFYSKVQAQGWISGTIEKPADCAKVGASACERCYSSPFKADCLSCAAAASSSDKLIRGLMDFQQGSTTDSSTYQQLSAAEGCSNCQALATAAQRTTCVKQLVSRPATMTVEQGQLCAMAPTQRNDWNIRSFSFKQTEWLDGVKMRACSACVSKFGGGKYFGACASCAAAHDPAKCQGCMATLLDPAQSKPMLQFCGAAAYNPGCVDNAMCMHCSDSSNYGDCVACAAKKSFYEDCFNCVAYGLSPANEKGCLKCASRVTPALRQATDGLQGLLTCFTCFSTPEFLKSGCDKCVNDGPADRISECDACAANWYTDSVPGWAQKRAKCYSCTADPKNTHSDQCASAA